MVKFADDITISIPVSNDSTDATINEVNSIRDWAASNRMTLNHSKTWEMLIHGKTTKPNPQPVPDIERKSWLKLLGITFQENPCCWDLHVDKLITKASSRLYILRVCKFYGYSQDQVNKLFDSLILSLFAYGLRSGDLLLKSIWIKSTTSVNEPTDMVTLLKLILRYRPRLKRERQTSV